MPKSRLSRSAQLARIQMWMTHFATVVQQMEAELVTSFKMAQKLEGGVVAAQAECAKMERFVAQHKAVLRAARQYTRAKRVLAHCRGQLCENVRHLAEEIQVHKSLLEEVYTLKARMHAMCEDHHMILPKDF